ncbi:LPP20 family lipoprotein [Fodinibius sp. Rm-B-1B1-1]|uniref:LPP20 family lipoprotein n=1 Tax=Fodinibius alkaliphilus TaxID=3140241 RepID=UPI00315A948E
MSNQFYIHQIYLVLGLVFLAFTSSCSVTAEAQNSDLPKWVNNPSNQFSENQYLMAVGSSPTREGARTQAQSNLAQIFVSEVEVNESYVNEFEEITDSEEGISVRENTNLITRSEVNSNQQMRNVEIREVHEAPNGTFYALALMDRMETAQLYSREIESNRDNINALRKKASNTESSLDRLIYSKQALAAAQVNDMLINQRAVLTGQGSGREALLAEITQDFREAKKECTVKLVGELPREVQSEITRKLQNAGFEMANNSSPVIEMKANLRMEPVDLNRPKYEFIQWALQVEAQNKENGQWFSTYMSEGREGSMNEKYARQRSIQAVQEKLSSEFMDYINKELLSVD